MTTTEQSGTDLAPVVCRVTVPVAPRRAFDLFTTGIATWWPLQTHACDTDTALTCVLQPRVGGSIHEVAQDGTTAPWGTVTRWHPPAAVGFTWHPGRDAATAQQVEVAFTATDGGTEVVLTHRNWAVLGDAAERTRDGYVTGWAHVLGERFVTRAGA